MPLNLFQSQSENKKINDFSYERRKQMQEFSKGVSKHGGGFPYMRKVASK